MASRMTDEDLMARLRALGSQVDPVPDDVVLAGRSALAYRDLDLKLAKLVDESLLAGTGSRGDAEESWFTFEVDAVLIEMAVHVRGGTLHLLGQIDGADVQALKVMQSEHASVGEVDELGRFSCPVVPGPLRVEVTLQDGSRVATSWIVAARS